MTGRLAIDFGTSNTLMSVWDESLMEGRVIDISEYSRDITVSGGIVPVIPTVINYAADNRHWIGNQVIERGLYHSRQTIRWMKRYISVRSPIRMVINDKEITPYTAGNDFISSILTSAVEKFGIRPDEEIGISVPVDSYEHYESWLTTAIISAGFQRYRLIDESSAAALGYGLKIQPGQIFLIFDFGGGTMDCSVVMMDEEDQYNRRCRVLGKSGRFIGGTTIDQWIYEDLLNKNKLSEYQDSVRSMSTSILINCEKLKEELSIKQSAAYSLRDDKSSFMLEGILTRSRLEAIFEEHNLLADIEKLIRSALSSAQEKGFDKTNIQAVLVVGGSSQIPAVQRILQQSFGTGNVFLHRPYDAVVRGAAAFIAGIDFYDFIQHDYAIRHFDPQSGDYRYQIIIPRNTPYPSSKPVARLVIKPSLPDQSNLGIAIFEIGQPSAGNCSLELVFDSNGAVRIIPLMQEEKQRRVFFWMNEHQQTFLTANPPANPDNDRFQIDFWVDENKRLMMTARDLVSNQIIYHDYPVVKLS